MAYSSFVEFLKAAEKHGSLGRAALALEVEESGAPEPEVRARMTESLGVMREAVESGLSGEARSRSGFVGGDAARVAASHAGPLGGTFADAIAFGLATGEVNAAMGVIVAFAGFYTKAVAPSGDVNLGIGSISYFLLIACVILVLIGSLAGYFVVPMNALLQHRGHVLLSAGHSIAVQNFNENLSILVMLGLYAVLVWLDLSIRSVMLLFGLFVAVSMVLVIVRHRYNQRQFDSIALIGQLKH